MVNYFEEDFRLLKEDETDHQETVQRIIDALQDVQCSLIK